MTPTEDSVSALLDHLQGMVDWDAELARATPTYDLGKWKMFETDTHRLYARGNELIAYQKGPPYWSGRVRR